MVIKLKVMQCLSPALDFFFYNTCARLDYGPCHLSNKKIFEKVRNSTLRRTAME